MNGQICFGILVNEFPWNEEPWYGEWEEWWRDVNGYVNPFDLYTADGNYKPGVDRDEIDKYFDYQFDWDKANPFPVDLVRYCDGWILAVLSSTMIESGYPEKFDPASLVISYEEWQSLLTFCKKWGIATSTPEWWLSSDTHKQERIMIRQIQTTQKAQGILKAACEDKYAFSNLIFDLDESLDPNDVPVNVRECPACINRIYGLLGRYWECHCRECGALLYEIVTVDLVIQGNVVLSRREL